MIVGGVAIFLHCTKLAIVIGAFMIGTLCCAPTHGG